MKYMIVTAQTIRKRYIVEATNVMEARQKVFEHPESSTSVEESVAEVVDVTAFRPMKSRRERRR